MRKNTIDGITNQNTLIENSDINSVFLVSTYNHIMANTDMRGIEANTPPISVLRFAISEIITINMVVITIFKL